VELEERTHGDLDRVAFGDLSWVATRRMMRAVMRGDAMEALRWRRVRLIMDAEEAENTEALARFEAEDWRQEQETRSIEIEANGSNGSDGVF
jgi:hypothetical protein